MEVNSQQLQRAAQAVLAISNYGRQLDEINTYLEPLMETFGLNYVVFNQVQQMLQMKTIDAQDITIHAAVFSLDEVEDAFEVVLSTGPAEHRLDVIPDEQTGDYHCYQITGNVVTGVNGQPTGPVLLHEGPNDDPQQVVLYLIDQWTLNRNNEVINRLPDLIQIEEPMTSIYNSVTKAIQLLEADKQKKEAEGTWTQQDNQRYVALQARHQSITGMATTFQRWRWRIEYIRDVTPKAVFLD